jgi:hypothetical protein
MSTRHYQYVEWTACGWKRAKVEAFRVGIQELSWPELSGLLISQNCTSAGNIRNSAVCDKTFREGKQVKQRLVKMLERWSTYSEIYVF